MEMIASAPGKVFVTGEYAVVGGGPAVVATVTRRLRSRVRARRGAGQLVVRAGGRTVRCPLAIERVDELPREVRFVAGAALVSARLLGLAGTDLEVETESDLDPGASKTGLGGSAAVTAATVRAVHGLLAEPADDEAGERARVAAGVCAHRLVQGGGSAADVIAATIGGLVWLDGLDGSDVPRDVSDCVARVRGGARIVYERLVLPRGLVLEVVATGRSCATGPRVARYAALATDVGPAGACVRAWAAGMRVAAVAFRDACRRGDPALVLWSVRAAATLLSRLGAVATLPVYTTELRRACAVAVALPHTAVKPSGAGGGDCAVALVAHEQRMELRRRWREAGLTPLAVEIDPAGARCEVTT